MVYSGRLRVEFQYYFRRHGQTGSLLVGVRRTAVRESIFGKRSLLESEKTQSQR